MNAVKGTVQNGHVVLDQRPLRPAGVGAKTVRNGPRRHATACAGGSGGLRGAYPYPASPGQGKNPPKGGEGA